MAAGFPKKLRQVTNHGLKRWRVDLSEGEAGRRVRKFFDSRAAAEDYARKSAEAVREHGRRFARYWNSLSPLAQGNALHQIERLSRLGYSLRAAADFIESTRKILPSVPLEKAVADFMADKEARGLRPRSFRKLRAALEMFRDCAGAKLPLRDATETHVREFLSLNGWAAATRKTYLRDVRTFFRWAVRRKLLAESPADAVPLPLLEDKPPAILTPGEATALLDACQRERPSLLAWLALALFGGIRPEEARRLAWTDVRPDAVNIEGAKAKTRHRRVVPLTPQLRAWLDTAKAHGAALPPVGWQRKFRHVRTVAGLRVDWHQNAMRHSFCSYHLQLHGNAGRTAMIAGHSEAMLFAHYRERVSTADAEAFFGLLPDAAALAAGVEKERRDREAGDARRREGGRHGRTAQAPVPLPSNVIPLGSAVANHCQPVADALP
jgi:integrase